VTERILVIEDESKIADFVRRGLVYEGYAVDVAYDGESGLAQARREPPDLVVLDIMLPGIDGFEVCRILRQEMNTPILMLTARDDEIDRVVGLEVGADDYLTKPFSTRELMARIKALLRRVRLIREEMTQPSAGQALTPTYTYQNLTLDTSRRELKVNNLVIPLKPKEYELLLFLAQHRGQVISREYILEKVWGWDYIGDSRTVDVHIRWLREKIETNPAEPTRIITVRGAGYRFEG